MKKWLRRIRGAVLMGLTWAVIWAPIGLLIGAIVDPDGTMDEPWIMVGTLPGFLAGVIFSVVLGIAAGRRRLDELSVRKFAGWGALAGLLLGALPMIVGDYNPSVARWLPLVVLGSITLLTAASAAGSLALARRSASPQLTEGSADIASFAVAEGEPQELPGARR
jgi:hypothetical protein